MDIRQRQSVLSFVGGKLVVSPPLSKMPEAPVTNATKKNKSKKSKKFKKSKKRKNQVAVDGAAAASANPPKKHKRAVPNETKKRLRSFVKKTKNKRKKNKKKEKNTPSANAGGKNPSPCAQPPGSRKGEPESKAKAAMLKNKPKMTRVTPETMPEILEMEGCLVPSDATLEAETQHLNRQNTVSGFDGWMEAEIREMLNTKEEAFCLETSAKVDDLREQLPRMTRAEEDEWLVEVSPSSTNVCEMGSLNCESVCMSKAKGVNPPIMLPCVQKEGFNSFKMCLLCLRNTSTCTLLRLRMDRVSMIQDSCLQTHVNYVDLNGEYKKEHVLPIRRDKYEGVVAPMVAHFHSGYNGREKIDGAGKRTRYWAQDGYTMPSVMPYDVHHLEKSVDEQTNNGSFLLNAPRAEVTP